MIEVEARVKVDDFNSVKANLKEIGAKYIRSVKQTDNVFFLPKFMDANGKVMEGGIIARIRDDGKTKALEFKEISRAKGGIEIRHEDVQDEQTVRNFLGKLGFEEGLVLKKSRDSYSFQGFGIDLDDVEEAGRFVEVEKVIDFPEERETAKLECIHFLEKIAPSCPLEKRMYGDIIRDNREGKR